MFCIRCGKPAWKDNLCKKCFLETHKLFELKVPVIKIKECECGRYFLKKWTKPKKSLVDDITEKNIKTFGEVVKKDVSWKRQGNRYVVTVRLSGLVGGLKKEEEKEYIIIAKKNVCDVCTKKRGSYYEAKIQLRGVPLKKALSVIPEKYNDTITKVEKTKNGFNIYLSDKKIAARIIRELRHLNMKIKASYKLIGMKKGKKIYRNYYSVRLR